MCWSWDPNSFSGNIILQGVRKTGVIVMCHFSPPYVEQSASNLVCFIYGWLGFFSCIKYKEWWPYVSYTNGEKWDMLENAVFIALLSSNGATSDLSDFSVSFVWFVLFYPCPCFLTDLDRQCSHYWPFWHYRGMQNTCNNEKLAA